MAASGKPTLSDICDILLAELSDDEAGSDISSDSGDIHTIDISDIVEDDSDDNPDYIQGCDEINDSKEESCSQRSTPTSSLNRYILGRRNKEMIENNKQPFKWSLDPPSVHVIDIPPDVNDNVEINKPKTPIDALRFLIDDQMITTILKCTNEKISEMAADYMQKASDYNHFGPVDKVELEAFFGLVYLGGVCKANQEHTSDLFATDGTGREIFRSVMPKERFLFLLNSTRFDTIDTREERKENDPFAAISEIFNRFMANSNSNYTCGSCATIGEMFVPFKGKSKFKINDGLKLFILADSTTSYCLNGLIYCRNSNKLLKSTLEALHLVEPIKKSNRNVTANNYFSSVELTAELMNIGLTYVGTMRHNMPEIPATFLPDKTRPVLSTEFAFTNENTLVSYVPKYNKAILVISSMHHEKRILNDRHAKIPEIIDFYNTTKGGVENLSKKCAEFSVGRYTRRWPMTIWFILMDIAGVNAHIIFQSAYPSSCKERRAFLISLGRSLIENQLKRRSKLSTHCMHPMAIKRNADSNDADYKHIVSADVKEHQVAKRQRCHICPRNVDRKHSTRCLICRKCVCKNHSNQDVVCRSCGN